VRPVGRGSASNAFRCKLPGNNAGTTDAAGEYRTLTANSTTSATGARDDLPTAAGNEQTCVCSSIASSNEQASVCSGIASSNEQASVYSGVAASNEQSCICSGIANSEAARASCESRACRGGCANSTSATDA